MIPLLNIEYPLVNQVKMFSFYVNYISCFHKYKKLYVCMHMHARIHTHRKYKPECFQTVRYMSCLNFLIKYKWLLSCYSTKHKP